MMLLPTRMRPFPSLSGRANNALRNEGIETVERLAALTDHELRCIHGLGPKGLSEVRAFLAASPAQQEPNP